MNGMDEWQHKTNERMAGPPDPNSTAALRNGLEAAIRAAKLALFVIRKQGVMPNSSWESGFNSDLKAAEDALAALFVTNGVGK